MKILLDECLPLDFRRCFPNHDAHTVEWAGFKGEKNGELLKAAELAGYQVLLTVDQGIPHQQPHFGRSLSIICSALARIKSRISCLLWIR